MTRWSRLIAGLGLALAPFVATGQTLFADNAPKRADTALHAGWAEPDGRRVTGLRMDLAPGWKTYWRTPGDGGVPPEFDWTGSSNIAAVTIDWPAPRVFETYGLHTIGYERRMVLPISVTPEDPARPIRLRLTLFYGVCGEICIPERQDLALDIAPGAQDDGGEMIRAALAATPTPAAEAGLAAAQCDLDLSGEGRFTARLNFDAAPERAPIVVAEAANGVWIGPLMTRIEDSTLVAEGDATASGGWFDRSAVRFTLIGDGFGPQGAVTHTGCEAG